MAVRAQILIFSLWCYVCWGFLKGKVDKKIHKKQRKGRVKSSVLQARNWGTERLNDVHSVTPGIWALTSILLSPSHHTTCATNSPSLHVACALYEPPFKLSSPTHPTYIFTVNICLAGAAKEFPSQQIPIVLQECQVEVAEKLHVLVFHSELLRWVPVNHLRGKERENTFCC